MYLSIYFGKGNIGEEVPRGMAFNNITIW